FEAAMDMLLMTAVVDHYDRNGALARAAELVEMERLAERRDTANRLIGLSSPPLSHTPEEAAAIEGGYWEQGMSGAKTLMLQALADVRGSRERRRHWSGLGRHEIGKEIERLRGESEGLAAMADATYGLLSIHSHPRPRTTDR